MRWLVLALALTACNKGGDSEDSGPVDTDVDSDPPDTDIPADPWSWCPTADAYVGDSTWNARLDSSGVLWCSQGSEQFNLADEPGRKAQILLPSGDYNLPHENGQDYTAAFPMCSRFADESHVDMDGTGTLTSYHEAYYTYGTRWTWGLQQPMVRDGDPWTLQLNIYTLSEDDDPPTVDMGTDAQSPWHGDFIGAALFAGTYPNFTDSYWFVPCDYRNPAREETTHVEFQGGSIDLQLNIGESSASTEPAMFVSGSGTLDGTAFTQTDYWKLVYNPEHHHFMRDFAVLFDAPIGSACGLMVTNVDPYYPDGYGNGEPGTVQTIECDLTPIESRAVSAQETVRVTP